MTFQEMHFLGRSESAATYCERKIEHNMYDPYKIQLTSPSRLVLFAMQVPGESSQLNSMAAFAS